MNFKMSKGLEVLQKYRDESGRRIYEAGLVMTDGIIFHVRSETDENTEYDIEEGLDGGRLMCTCPDYAKRGEYLVCKHIRSVEYYILHLGGGN